MSDLPTIPIVGGTGALGAGLALRWAQAGTPIAIGSRSAERAEEAAAKLREKVPGATVEGLLNEDAARRGEIVFLTVPFRNQSENLNNLRESLRPGQILVDCTVPLAAAVSGKATRSLGVWQGSAAQQAQEMVPEGVTVIGAGRLPSTMPQAASTAYARNLVALLAALMPQGAVALDLGDEIQAAVVVTHGGKVVNPRVRELIDERKEIRS